MDPKLDFVGVVEQAYRLDVDDASWLSQVGTAAKPILDRGMGVFAFFYDVIDGTSYRIGTTVNLGAPPAVPQIIAESAPLSPPEMTQRFVWAPPFTTSLTILGEGPTSEFLREIMRPHGAEDVLLVKASDPSGPALALCAPLSELRPAIPRRTAQLWTRIATHLAAAHRLRRELDGDGKARLFRDAEAIVTPDGKLEHAEEPAKSANARDALRAAARRMDQARGRMRKDTPDAAVELWRGLVAGRWSLVDEFDTDGRRYLIARRNDPRTRDPRALTERERQIASYAALGHANKLIAYDLGLSEATVATHLRRAMAKLGVQTRIELVERIQQLGMPQVGRVDAGETA